MRPGVVVRGFARLLSAAVLEADQDPLTVLVSRDVAARCVRGIELTIPASDYFAVRGDLETDEDSRFDAERRCVDGIAAGAVAEDVLFAIARLGLDSTAGV